MVTLVSQDAERLRNELLVEEVEKRLTMALSRDIIKLTLSIVACLCAGVIGSIFTTPAIPTWYASLEKPLFTPPNWLFAPAWTILYLRQEPRI